MQMLASAVKRKKRGLFHSSLELTKSKKKVFKSVANTQDGKRERGREVRLSEANLCVDNTIKERGGSCGVKRVRVAALS